MSRIDSTKFGEIIIDGKKYFQVLIIGDRVIERDYEKLTELYGTSHKIGDWEIENLLGENPEIIVVGTGQDGMLKIRRDFSNKFAKIEVIAVKTPEAIKIYNEKVKEGRRINGLIHTTC